MTEHHVEPRMSRREILSEVLAAEREIKQLLDEAARLAPNAEERHLYGSLAEKESQALAALRDEQDRLDAVDFVQKALDV